jgi:hypothetical protein
MDYQNRVSDFWNIATWLSIAYFVLFAVLNIGGLIWIKLTTEPKKKKKIEQTIDWTRR